MERRVAERDAAFGLKTGIVIVDAGGDLGRRAEQLGVDVRPRRHRAGGELANVRGIEAEQRRKDRLILAAQIAVHDQFDARSDHARYAQRQAAAGLAGKRVRRRGAAPVGVEFARCRRHQARARQAEMLIVARYIEPGAALGAGVAQVADRVALAHVVVDAIAVRIDPVAEHRNRERPCEASGGGVEFALVERAEAGFHAPGRRLRHAGLGDDIDDAADGAVAVKHRAAVAAGDFDALDAVARDRAEIDAGEIDVGQPASVEQNERVGDRCRAETAQVDRRAGAVLAAGRADGLDTHLLRQQVLNRRAGRARDVLGGDDAGGGADNSGAGAAGPDIDERQHLRVLRIRGVCRKAGQREQRAADRPFRSHDATFLRLRARNGGASGETKPGAKDTLSGTHTTTRDAHVCNVVGEAALTASHRHCRHRCERPLRMDAPSTGWVTALAGLLARGSLPSCVRPSRFPSGHTDAGSPLTVAGAATDFCEQADAVFPLSSPESPGEPAR